jgi:protocatechuate 3,4-dioxygenase beta subunit
VFLLPEPTLVEHDQPQHLSVTLEGGQTVAMEIRVGDGPCRGVSEYVIQIASAEAPGREIRSGLNRHIVWADEQQSLWWVWDTL